MMKAPLKSDCSPLGRVVSGYCDSLKDKGNGDFTWIAGRFSSSLILCLVLFREQGSKSGAGVQPVCGSPRQSGLLVVVCQEERIRENMAEEEMGAEGNWLCGNQFCFSLTKTRT